MGKRELRSGSPTSTRRRLDRHGVLKKQGLARRQLNDRVSPNAALFEVRPMDRDEDRLDGRLRILVRDGQSIGGVLVSEGIARWYNGDRQP